MPLFAPDPIHLWRRRRQWIPTAAADAGGGPVAIRSVTVGTNNGSSATVSATTPSDTAVGDLLIIIHGNDFHLLSNMPTPTVTGSPTVTAIPDAVADGGTNLAHIKGYWAVANTSDANTVSVTETGTADEEKCMVVYVLTGADTSDPIDAAANNTGTTTNSQVAPAVSPTSSDAYVITHVNSGGGGSAAAYTSPGDVTEQYEVHVGGLSGVGAVKQLAASGSTGTFTYTTGVDSTPYGAVTIAVRTAAGGGNATVTPAVIACTTTVGQPAVNVGAAPAATAATTTVPRPAVNVAAAPASTAAVTALPQPAVSVAAAPVVIPVTVSLPQATPDTGGTSATATPSVIAAVTALPAAAVTVGASPAAIAAIAAMTKAAVAVTAAPLTVVAVTTVPGPAVSIGAVPSAIPVVVALPQATPDTGGTAATATPATIAATVALPPAAVSVGARPAVLQALVALPQAAAGSSTAATPASITVTVTIPAGVVSVGAAPAVIAVTVTLPTPVAGSGIHNADSLASVAAAVASVAAVYAATPSTPAVSAARTSAGTIEG